MAAQGEDVECQFLQKHYSDTLKRALHEAVAKLPERQRAILRYDDVHKLNATQIAPIFKVHNGTISRQLIWIRAQVSNDAKEIMTKEMGIPSQDLASIMRLIPSQLSLSLSRLLGDTEPESQFP